MVARQIAFDQIEAQEHVACMLEQYQSGLGRGDSGTIANHQRGACELLHLRDVLADGRRRNAFDFRGARDAPGFADRHKELQ